MELQEIVTLCEKALDDMKAEDILVVDVMGKSSMSDILIFATGTSTRHVKSLAHSVNADVKNAGLEPFGMEGVNEGQWALVDIGDIVVHIMLPDVREFYQLERLWQGDSEEATEA